jgi:hypothetical protein
VKKIDKKRTSGITHERQSYPDRIEKTQALVQAEVLVFRDDVIFNWE